MTDLRQEDFTVIEDGVRQNIAHFSFQALTAIPVDPSAPTKGLLRKIPVAELTPETRRTFLIVLGRGRLQHPSRGIDGLLTFVRKDLLPQDLVAVLAYNRAATTGASRCSRSTARRSSPIAASPRRRSTKKK